MSPSEINENDSLDFKKQILSLQELLKTKNKQLTSQNDQLTSQNDQLTKKDDQITKKDDQIQYLEGENSRLNEVITLFQNKIFSQKSEALNSDQLGLFNEAEATQAEERKNNQSLEVKNYQRGKPKRKPLPEHLPREEVVIELDGKDRQCDEGHELKVIGEETSEQLDIVPAKITVIKTIRKKYACPKCEATVKTAPLPPAAIPKSMATAGFLSFILICKYVDALPLYRVVEILKRSGIAISRGTLASWMIKVGQLLQPLWNMLEEDLLESTYLSCDETRVQVLKEDGKKATSLSYMWVRCRSGPEISPIYLFDYAPSRSGKVASSLLSGFQGYLQVDGYGGYNEVSAQEGVIRVGCWAHARRKFHEAYQASKKGHGKAEDLLLLIKKLYQVESECEEKTATQRYEQRRAKSNPILDEIRSALDENKGRVPPKSKLGEAYTYLDNEWPNLIRYLEDGRLQIDNNPVENAIRPFAIGRKNWLFSDSVAGAESSAIIYSLVQTAKANGQDLYSYFNHILKELPKAEEAKAFETLLPHQLDPKKIALENPFQ